MKLSMTGQAKGDF